MKGEDNVEEINIIASAQAVYFENPSNFYKVVRVFVEEDPQQVIQNDEIVMTGQFISLQMDTSYEFFGKLVQHPKYGQQFAVSHYRQIAPQSKEGLVNYLSSDRFKGIGIRTAEKIIACLGEDAIDQILNDPACLDKVPGLSAKNAKNLTDSLLAHQGTERIFVQLNLWGFGPKIAEKIYKIYQTETLNKIKDNPYELIEKIDGIGFQKVDQLAISLGFDPSASQRLSAAWVEVVKQICYQQGNTSVSVSLAQQKAQSLLERCQSVLILKEDLIQALDEAILQERLILDQESLMLPSIFYAEYGASQKIHRFMQESQHFDIEDDEINQAIKEIEDLLEIIYDSQQKAALKLAIQSPMSIITGGPGTGKTTLVQGLIYLHAKLEGYDLDDLTPSNINSPIRLAAPTGRAAKRMQESSQLPAVTIHRLIGFTRESVIENFTPEEIEGSLLIIDEMSMVDVWLMNWLLQAIPSHIQVVFVGDQDQLPSVGPGKVFADLIASQVIPTIFLTKIYRQAQDSSIVSLAHNIRKGYLPSNFLDKQEDRSFIPCDSSQIGYMIQQVIDYAKKKSFSGQNMQVLAPMYKGQAGITQINHLLQEQLNPASVKKRQIKHYDQVLRQGDKVLQLVNNTDEGVYNGDIGWVCAILTAKESPSKQEELVVDFDGTEVHYTKNELDQLTLAYCCSIHKAQGSEYDLVILPLIDMHSPLLRRDVVYTAVTRASKFLILLGNPNSFQKAVASQQVERETHLKDYLQLLFNKKLDKQKSQSITSSQKSITQGQNSDLTILNTQADLNHRQSNVHSSNLSDEEMQLTDESIFMIDPMIGMGDLTPFDFMKVQK